MITVHLKYYSNLVKPVTLLYDEYYYDSGDLCIPDIAATEAQFDSITMPQISIEMEAGPLTESSLKVLIDPTYYILPDDDGSCTLPIISVRLVNLENQDGTLLVAPSIDSSFHS